MSDQRVTSLDTDGGLGETSRDRRPLQPLLAKGSASVKKLSSNPPPSQGIFATPENESFYKLYSYSDLESTEQDIRLIHVFKDEHCDLIQCEFLPQSSLREASGSYHTLSYCAGDPLKAEPVLLQGIKFNAFANLQHALEQTLSLWKHKYPQEECVLWVDQICINQRNDAERSHQVGLMRDIYTNCRGTFISLSTADSYETGSNGMDWLRELAEAYQLPGTSQARRDKFWCILQENISNYNFFEGWYSFYELFQCPWWRRAWIHQEFICSPSATFMYHDSTIFSTHTSFLLLLCRTLSAFGIIGFLVLEAERSKKTRVPKIDRDLVMEICARNERARDSLEAVQLLLGSKETWRGDEDLKKVLAGSRHCRSSDPRDRIFAFLGLAHPGYGIETDYRKSNTLRATIIHTAKKILEFDQHLEMLAFAVRTIIVRPGVLPSWVPDWASTMILEDGHFARLPGQDKQFQHDTIGSSVIHPSTDANSVFLRVRGLHIDTLGRPRLSGNPAGRESIFVTIRDHTVRTRTSARQGDELWMLMGSKWPLILRPCNEGFMVLSEAENINHDVWDAKDIHFDEILGRMRNGLERLRIIDLC